MIRRFLLRLWEYPWPPRVRRLAEPLVNSSILQRFAVPHFRCGVVAIIRNDAGQVLLFRHTYRVEYPWGLPSGFLNPGEQPAAAVHRELSEEAGLGIDLGPVWRVYTDEHSIVNIVFLGRAGEGSFTPSVEVSRAAFFSPADMPPVSPTQCSLILESAKESMSAHSA